MNPQLRLLLIPFCACMILSSCQNRQENTSGTPATKNDSIEKVAEKIAPAFDTSVVTIAAIRATAKGGKEILFNEREHIFEYKVDTSLEGNAKALRPEAVLKSKQHVLLVSDLKNNSIVSLTKLSDKETDAFKSLDKNNTKAQKSIRADLVYDTLFENRNYAILPPWLFKCDSVVPNYATAKSIFDYCAKQSCSNPAPYDISPCIPFQYVIDGCYARAHKMCQLITSKYHYCNEKVFSFANQNDDVLSVKANKWGGCCVTWWYHVAPIVRVRYSLGLPGHKKPISFVVVYVIDPGMFDQPVPLSTWLAAQANTSCNSRAHVSSYNIQPSTSYAPADYSGAVFSTDASQMNNTLLGYQHLTTCP